MIKIDDTKFAELEKRLKWVEYREQQAKDALKSAIRQAELTCLFHDVPALQTKPRWWR